MDCHWSCMKAENVHSMVPAKDAKELSEIDLIMHCLLYFYQWFPQRTQRSSGRLINYIIAFNQPPSAPLPSLREIYFLPNLAPLRPLRERRLLNRTFNSSPKIRIHFSHQCIHYITTGRTLTGANVIDQ
jgi:hypothetical protein